MARHRRIQAWNSPWARGAPPGGWHDRRNGEPLREQDDPEAVDLVSRLAEADVRVFSKLMANSISP